MNRRSAGFMALCFATAAACGHTGFAKPMAVYVLNFKTDIKGDNASAASDMSLAIGAALTKRRAAFQVLERSQLGELVQQHHLERDLQSIVSGEKASQRLMEDLKGADGFVRGELLNRVDGVTLTVSLIRLNSEKVLQWQKRHSLIEWLNGDVRQIDAEAFAVEAAAALLPPTANVEPGDDGPRGIKLASDGQCPDALPFLQNAANIDSSNAELYFWIGHCLNEAGEFAGAARSLTTAISRNPRRADYFAERARSLAAQSFDSRALDDLDQSLRLDHRNLAAIELRGDMFLKSGKYDDAVNAYYAAYQQGASRERCRKLMNAYRKNGAGDAADKLEHSCAALP